MASAASSSTGMVRVAASAQAEKDRSARIQTIQAQPELLAFKEQQFERAVEFLWRRGMVVEAAHFALAMFHAGVLNVVDLQRPVTADDVAILEEGGAEGDDGMHGHGLGHGQGGLVGGHGEQQPQPAINLGLLLRDYTSQFWQSHPQCAVDYYATLWDFQVRDVLTG